MEPKKYLHKLAQAVSRRSGISINTCLVVLPALFDEMRYMLCEGDYRCVTVESFGTLTVKERPRRHYRRLFPDGTSQLIELPPKLIVKFLPTANLRREVEQSRFDPTRQSFVIHPDDHGIRTRKAVKSKAKKHDMFFAIDGVVKRDEPVPDHPKRIRIIRGKDSSDE